MQPVCDGKATTYKTRESGEASGAGTKGTVGHLLTITDHEGSKTASHTRNADWDGGRKKRFRKRLLARDRYAKVRRESVVS